MAKTKSNATTGTSSLRLSISLSVKKLFRLSRLAVHLSIGLVIVTFIFPRKSCTQRARRTQRWSGQLNQILGLDVHMHGNPSVSAGSLLVANHISWLDIFAINAISPVRFVAKSEVRRWPLIGQLCQATGTLFIDRTRKKDTLRANQEIHHALSEGHVVAVFPEGTTSDGSILKPFRSALFQTAIAQQATIQPVYLRYLGADGKPSGDAAYHDDITFGASLWKLLGHAGLKIELYYLPIITISSNDDRHTLAHHLENTLRTVHQSLTPRLLDESAAHLPETTPHLQVAAR